MRQDAITNAVTGWSSMATTAGSAVSGSGRVAEQLAAASLATVFPAPRAGIEASSNPVTGQEPGPTAHHADARGPQEPAADSPGALMISSMAGAENCAALMTRQLGIRVEVVTTRRLGLAALRRQEYAVLILEESVAEADPQGADLLWQNAGLAVAVQVNFAISGCARLVREVRSALARREQQEGAAMRAATIRIESELKSTVTGLLLQSQLALAEPSLSPQLTAKLKQMVELAGSLRERLRPQPGAPA